MSAMTNVAALKQPVDAAALGHLQSVAGDCLSDVYLVSPTVALGTHDDLSWSMNHRPAGPGGSEAW